MGSRSSCRALAVAAGVALVAAGCGGSGGGASAAPFGCAARASAGNLLWQGSTVYFVEGRTVLSSAGLRRSLPLGARAAGFVACRPPVLLFRVGDELEATRLVAGRARRPSKLGYARIATPDGRLVSFSGTRIRQAGGRSFAVRDLPAKWRIASLAASPADASAFLASVQSPEAGIELCGKGLGSVDRVSPAGSRTLLVDNPCHDRPQPSWSPDGSRISYLDSASNALWTVSSAGTSGRQRVATRGKVVGYLWSPDGRRIAYESRSNGASSVWVSTLGAGTRRLAAGKLAGWSSDGREVAVVRGRTLVAVPVAGGAPRALLHL